MDKDVDGNCKPKEAEGKQIVVIMVGGPGSGKSTFCEHVMRCSSRPWVRICQDVINNGKAGTKPQCLKSAANAIKEGKSVFIDRCNMDREQRVEFVKLGGPQVEVHAVVLDLPAQLCISRSVKRTGHEGNLQGGKAAAVVNRMLQKKELPKLNEGFHRTMFCRNENDVQAAMNIYGALGPLDGLHGGCFGQKDPDAKIQLGIMKFLKREEVPSNKEPNSDAVRDSACPQISKESEPCCKEIDDAPSSNDTASLLSGPAGHSVNESEYQMKGSVGNDVSPNYIPTLAFPSISTADFQFNNEKASDIIVEKVEEFVNKIGNARLVLVDLSQGSKILSLVRTKAAQRNIDSKKFFTFVGNITRLYSVGALLCKVIANAANWRLKPGGGGVNAAIFSAAGTALEVATKEQAESLSPGRAVVVPLPSHSPLSSREGVSHVIHVLGPNMNPQRPNCLNDDYTEGSKILREAYTSLFDGFVSIVRSQAKPPRAALEHSKLKDLSHSGPMLPGNKATCDQKVKRKDDSPSQRSKKCKGSHDELAAAITLAGSTSGKFARDISKVDGSTSESWGSWAQALYDIAMNPEKHKDELLEISNDVVVLYDLYPKVKVPNPSY